MAPSITDHVGASGLASRDLLIDWLRCLAAGNDRVYELQRRRKVASVLEQLRQQKLQQPELLVAAPLQVLMQEFENLPPGVRLNPGLITVEFEDPPQALEKLLALAMAIGNDFQHFTRMTSSPGSKPEAS